MFLSDLTEKNVYVGKNFRGYCLGIGISLKSHAVKYLLCASALTKNSATDFSVGVSAVSFVGENINLTKLRPLFPKNCAKIFIGRPIYSPDGIFLGNITDLEIKDFVATRLFSDRNEAFPVTSIVACSDAVILRKEPPYPIGQRIPAPFLPILTNKPDSVVTKPVLKTALKKSTLIKLTLSLPPFNLTLDSTPRRKLL